MKIKSNMFFILIAVLITTVSVSCSVTDLGTTRNYYSNNQETFLSKTELSQLDKEYKSFSTKALSDAYVSRMFNKFLITLPNPTQVIRQLEFARYMKDIKSEPGYFNSLKNFIGSDIAKFNLINNTNGVSQKKSLESATFGVFVDSLNPTTIDTDAQAFITATGITDTNQKNAIKTLVTDLKSANIWTKMKAVYPFVGGTAGSHKWNLKDPRDLDAAFRLQFYGGWTHSATGAKPNGTNGYADTRVNSNTVLSLNSNHISYYSRTETMSDAVEMGISDVGIKNILALESYSGIRYYYSFSNDFIGNSFTTTRGLVLVSRLTSTVYKGYKDANLEHTYVLNSTSKPNGNIYIGAYNNNGTPTLYSDKECAFSTIGDGLTDSEVSDFYTAVQKFETTLGRQVN